MYIYLLLVLINLLLKWGLGIGDWGLGPIPNPHSPNPHQVINNLLINYTLNNYNKPNI